MLSVNIGTRQFWLCRFKKLGPYKGRVVLFWVRRLSKVRAKQNTAKTRRCAYKQLWKSTWIWNLATFNTNWGEFILLEWLNLYHSEHHRIFEVINVSTPHSHCPLSGMEHLHNMLIEICTAHSVADVSSKYWVGHLLRVREAGGIEWRLSDQLTEHGMSPCCHLTGGWPQQS